MNEVLNDAVLMAVESAATRPDNKRIDDYGQRAALGMARMWLEHHQLFLEPNAADKYIGRDALAEELVGIIDGYDKEDAKAALAYARAVVNEPFRDPTMNGQRVRETTLKPKEASRT